MSSFNIFIIYFLHVCVCLCESVYKYEVRGQLSGAGSPHLLHCGRVFLVSLAMLCTSSKNFQATILPLSSTLLEKC